MSAAPKLLFITGGSGLLALNWAIAARPRARVMLGLHQRRISLSGVESAEVGLDTSDDVLRFLDQAEPAAVVHAAGLTSVEACEADPGRAQHINVRIPEVVAGACARRGIPLAHISTDHLFSGETPLADEAQPVDPKNVYGRTKAEAEVRVLEAHPGALVIRTNFYGWGPAYRRSFSDSIIHPLRAGQRASLFTDVHFTPILIETLAGAVEGLFALGASGVFSVVGDERISKYDFGVLVARTFGLDESLLDPVQLAARPDLVRRPRDMSLSNRKLTGALGRTMGGNAAQVARLREQELNGMIEEIRKL